MTLDEAISSLNKLCYVYFEIDYKQSARLSKPTKIQEELFELFNAKLPNRTNVVSTKS